MPDNSFRKETAYTTSSAYGLNNPLTNVFPSPISAARAPTTADINYLPGQVWIYQVSSTVFYAYVLGGIDASQQAVWLQTSTGGEALNELGASSGDTTVTPTAGSIAINGTANQITATGVDATSEIDLSIPSTFVAPGSIAATTTVTATLGDITATNGDLVLNTAGNGVQVKTGANARAGVGAVLVAGTLDVANTSVTANTIIIPVVTALGTVAAPQALLITKDPGVKFTVTSADGTDTSTFDWYMVEALA